MASRFVVPCEDGAVDFVADGVGFRYVELSVEEEARVRAEAAKYFVRKEEIEHYDHDDYGKYDYVEDVIDYEINEVKSLSERIWLEKEGACDVIVADGVFVGVVFFTGFTDYRGLPENGFTPIEKLGSREGLTRFCSVDISILSRDEKELPAATRTTTAQYNLSGRATTSYSTHYYLVKR